MDLFMLLKYELKKEAVFLVSFNNLCPQIISKVINLKKSQLSHCHKIWGWTPKSLDSSRLINNNWEEPTVKKVKIPVKKVRNFRIFV